MTTAEYNKTVDLYSDRLYRFVLKNMRNADAARDVVQDTFEKVWRKVNEISFETSKSYLFKAGYNTMIDHLRKEKHKVELDQVDYSHPQTNHGFLGIQEILNEALNRLPEIQKTVVLLRDYEGYSYDEIAEITGLGESQVKVYIFRARKAMKEFFVKIETII